MKHLIPLLLFSASALASPLRVVTTIPDLADFVRTVGGDQVDVTYLARGKEDPHDVMIKPSMITHLAQADLFIEMGLDLEHAYAPALVAESRNQKIQLNQPGHLDASSAIHPRDIPTNLDRTEGDQHPAGNPHFNLDPVRMQKVVQLIADRLSDLAPLHRTMFQANARAYQAKLDDKLKEWKSKFSGKKVSFVSYHPAWVYFEERFGVHLAGTIQPKPGIEPGPRHIEELIQLMTKNHVRLIVKESYYSDRFPQELGKQTGAHVVSVPLMVGGTPEATDYVHMMDQVVAAFASP